MVSRHNLLNILSTLTHGSFTPGATTAELHALESFAPTSDLKDGKWLEDMPIDKLLLKEYWVNYGSKCKYPLPKHMGRFPLMDGSGKYWDVSHHRMKVKNEVDLDFDRS